MGTGVLFYLLAYLGLANGEPSLVPHALSLFAAGIAIGCIEAAQHAAVASQVPANLRGSAFGMLAGVQGFGNVAASAVAGILWTLNSGSVAFDYLASWMLLAMSGILRLAAGSSTTIATQQISVRENGFFAEA
jgi:hypothetical protein